MLVRAPLNPTEARSASAPGRRSPEAHHVYAQPLQHHAPSAEPQQGEVAAVVQRDLGRQARS